LAFDDIPYIYGLGRELGRKYRGFRVGKNKGKMEKVLLRNYDFLRKM
jgi:hypothetical protein